MDTLLNASIMLVSVMDKVTDSTLPEKISDVVKLHSKGAAAAALGAAWLPGVGSSVAVAACAGFIWTMYLRINSLLGISITKSIIKTVASGVATNLAAAVVSSLVMSAAFSIVPGIGSVGASVIMGITCYALTLTSGIVYLKILTKVFKAGKDPSNISSESFSNLAKETIKDEDVKSIMKEARNEFKKAKESGELEKWKDIKIDLEKEE